MFPYLEINKLSTYLNDIRVKCNTTCITLETNSPSAPTKGFAENQWPSCLHTKVGDGDNTHWGKMAKNT